MEGREVLNDLDPGCLTILAIFTILTNLAAVWYDLEFDDGWEGLEDGDDDDVVEGCCCS